MKIVDTSVYVGPNIYALLPVIRHQVDAGALADWPTGRLDSSITDALLAALPALADDERLSTRLSEGSGLALPELMQIAALELQRMAGIQVEFGTTLADPDGRHYQVVYEYQNREVGLEAGELALNLIHHLLPADLRPDGDPAEPFDFDDERDDFIRFTQRRALGPSTASLVEAAEARGIPWLRLNEHSLIQLGHGCYQTRIQATVTGETRHIAVELASDKEETNRILGDLGLPVPRQQLVYSVRRALRAAERIGYPVVVKPFNANHGRGVSINLCDEDAVETAYDKAREHSRGVIVESFITGLDHRLLVVNGKLVAASKRVPGHVIGDGTHNIEWLVDQVNSDPRRGVGHEKVLTRLEFDHQAERLLADQGYDRNTVPGDREVVYLRTTANLSTGGTAIDVTDIIHPDNREMAIRAVKAIGLDVAGVDYLTSDISEPYHVTGGAICELNAAPGFRMHVAPTEGTPRDVAGPVMDMLFPPGSQSRIPIAAITGTNGKTTTSRMLAHIQKMAGHTVGLTSTDGVYIDGQLTVKGDMTGPASANMVLRDPSVDAAVLETARGGLLRSGMAYRECNVAACLNVTSDHLGLRGIDTLEGLAAVKSIVVRVARDVVVLNADDLQCLKMADRCTAERICYITLNHDHPLVREHIREGGLAAVLEQGMNGHMIALYDKGHHIPLLWSHLIPATLEGRALHNVQNAMFAAAMAYALDLNLESIRQGLRTFDSSYYQAPGRMNVYDEHPFKVVLDYAHNPAAVKVICQVVQRLDVTGRRIVVLAAPGDRRDEDIEEIAAMAAGQFDHYVCRQDDNRRGREPLEVPELLSRSLIRQGVDPTHITIIGDEQQANEGALQMARAGDLVLILCDAVARSWKQIIYFEPDESVTREYQHEAGTMDLGTLDLGDFKLDGSVRLVRDKRGVRLASDGPDDGGP